MMKNHTNWEGAFRVPSFVRYPAKIKAGAVSNGLMSHNDWLPTLCAFAGESDIVNKCKKGYTANGNTYKVHLDGYDQSAFLTSISGTVSKNANVKSARNTFFYADDDGLLVGLRQGFYKYVYAEQRSAGTMQVWAEPFTEMRLSKIFNLFQDPYERADITSNTFWDWQVNHVGSIYGSMNEVFAFSESFKEFPPRSFPPSFVPTNVMKETLEVEKQKQMQQQQSPSKKK